MKVNRRQIVILFFFLLVKSVPLGLYWTTYEAQTDGKECVKDLRRYFRGVKTPQGTPVLSDLRTQHQQNASSLAKVVICQDRYDVM